MKQIRGYVGQVNTWAVIAALALTGWLIDSLLWYLETHALTLAEFLTFLTHSWYALPLLGAIFIILRLRRPSELLSLTIYDERGVPIYRQGDFRLAESVWVPMLASFQGQTQENGLHHIKLPAGPVIYFLRQGGLTLVSCFSGPPRPAQLQEGLHLLQQQETRAEDLLHNLPPDVAALAANLLNAPVERDLLIVLWANRRMSMAIGGWAGRVAHNENEVAGALQNLEQWGLVQPWHIQDLVFYRLTSDKTRLGRLGRFITWRDGWLTHVQRVEQLVGPTNSNMNTIKT